MSVGVVNKSTGDRIPTAGNPLDKVGNLSSLTTTAKTDAVSAINEVNAGLATKADLTDLAPAFSASTAYTVGQYVSYDGNIYKCTSAHSAGAWVAGDFTLVAVASELESKQNATDNTLQTTDKTVVGAINEHEGDISSLMSGLTNVNTALSVPVGSGKNLIPMTIDGIKSLNTTGTWNGDSYTLNDVTFAFTISNGLVTSIAVNGSSSSESQFFVPIGSVTLANGVGYKVNGISGGSDTTYRLNVQGISNYTSGDNEITGDGNSHNVRLNIMGSATVDFTTTPMIRPATITDPTFAPYIPSVESRIEAVESGNYKVIASVTGDGVKTAAQALPDLFASVATYDKKYALIYGKTVLRMATKTTNNAQFGCVYNYQGTTYLLTINIQASNAYFTEVSIAPNGTVTVNDRSSEVLANGGVVSLVI